MKLVGDVGRPEAPEKSSTSARSFLEPWRRRRVELIAQTSKIRKRRARKLTARRACGEKIRDLGAVALEPVER